MRENNCDSIQLLTKCQKLEMSGCPLITEQSIKFLTNCQLLVFDKSDKISDEFIHSLKEKYPHSLT